MFGASGADGGRGGTMTSLLTGTRLRAIGWYLLQQAALILVAALSTRVGAFFVGSETHLPWLWPLTGVGIAALTLLGVGAVLGLVNALVAPVVKFLALPFILVTLGLFLLVVNAGMLLLTSRISQALDLRFEVTGFWTAVGGALVVSVAASVLHRLLDPDD